MERKEVIVSEQELARQKEFTRKMREMNDRRTRTPLALVDTFGCQQNVADGEVLMGMLREMGYELTRDENQADVILLNTCAIREHAEKRVYGHLGRLSHTKAAKPDQIICLCGCMAQQKVVADKVKNSYHHVDLVLGPQAEWRLPELLHEVYTKNKRVFSIENEHGRIAEDLPIVREGGVRAWVSIMYGCNNFCSYCIVPYVRGRERSRKPEEIVAEIKRLVADGVVEIMLLGQNVNSYGKNLEEPMTFAQLLREVNKIEGLKRIRFMTSHPKDLSEELIDAMRDCEKVCLHLHLPLQSGSSRILKLMNRRYTKEQYLDLVDRIRAKVPDVSLTTDIIVGFPGETEEDFLETMDVVRKVRYDSAFTFQYSRRTGTPAAAMEDQIPVDVVKDRFDRLLAEVQEISREVTARHTHTVQEVLVESINEQDPSLVTGRMSNNTLVHFKGDASLIGTLQNVYLDECRGFYYMGTPVENN